MSDNTAIKNKFEMVVMASARAHQLLRGCTPRVDGPEKTARLAMKEIKTGQVRKADA